ncbi:MAG: ABC transporter ATP-binding protein [Parvibaculaceae bacterium]
MASVRLKAVRKNYDKVPAVRGIDLEIADGEFVVFVGPSGCGKSTTLRMIAGLEELDGGDIFIGDGRVNDLEPSERDVAMVFQNYALYPHMTVRENMSFGLRMRKVPADEIASRIQSAARMLNIGELLERRPRQLSGGQRQRIAMGRAIVRNPSVFLFDEPLSNLDATLRVQVRTEIKKFHQRTRATIVYVTHDQVEAMTLADRIVTMNNGVIEQCGTPQEMYDQPATRFVASFIGSPMMNFVPARLEASGSGLAVRVSDNLSLPVPAGRENRYRPYRDREIVFGIRPEHITERRAHVGAEQHDFAADVEVVEPMGIDTLVYIRLAGTEVCARSTPQAAAGPGQSMSFTIDMARMHLIDPATDKVI